MGIYLDLVFVLNFLVDFLLLLGTNRLAGHSVSFGRCAMAALLGAVYAVACLLPGLSFLGNNLWRLVTLAAISAVAFGWCPSAVQRGGVFVLLSMALGGIATGFGSGSFSMLLASSFGLWVLCRVSFRGRVGQQEYVPVELCWNDRKVTLTALRDTGNLLRDPITGEQVLVAGADVAVELLGVTEYQLRHPVEMLAAGTIPGMRLIPYRAVGQSGSMLPAVRFSGARIGTLRTDALVAFAPEVLTRSGVYQMLTGGAV